jgi:hypothetical protein
MKRILITGGAGYIGSHTAKAVWRKGWVPVVFDNFSAGHEWAVQWGPGVRADLADSEAIRSAIRQYRPEIAVGIRASGVGAERALFGIPENPRRPAPGRDGDDRAGPPLLPDYLCRDHSVRAHSIHDHVAGFRRHRRLHGADGGSGNPTDPSDPLASQHVPRGVSQLSGCASQAGAGGPAWRPAWIAFLFPFPPAADILHRPNRFRLARRTRPSVAGRRT